MQSSSSVMKLLFNIDSSLMPATMHDMTYSPPV